MAAPVAVMVGMVAIAVLSFAVGVLSLAQCAGGTSLPFFGIGIIVLGLLATVSGGGPAAFYATFAFGLILVIAGFVIQHGAGCAFGL